MLHSTLEDHSALARELISAIDAGDMARTGALLDERFELHYPGMPDPISRSMLLEMIGGYFEAFPDMRHDVLDVLPSGDRVALRMVVYGTHSGAYDGIPPTGRTVAVSALHVLRVASGRIAEWWAAEDDLGLLRQLGAVVAVPGPVKAIVRRYFDDLLNGRQAAVVDEIIEDECAVVVPGLPAIRGIETIRSVIVGLHRTFPDLRFEVHDVIAEQDRVVASWTMTGTHHGEWLGVAATARALSVTGVDIFHVADGRIARIEIQADYLGAMRQMGVAVGDR